MSSSTFVQAKAPVQRRAETPSPEGKQLSRQADSPSANFGVSPIQQQTAVSPQSSPLQAQVESPVQRQVNPAQENGSTPVQQQADPEKDNQQGKAPVQRQANAPLQLKPSTEIPDLDETVVEAVNKALAADDKQKALDLIMAALAKKDPKKFDTSYLDGGKLKLGYGARTKRGPKFKAWLEKQLLAGAKTNEKIKTDKKEMRKYLATLTVPKESLDFEVYIGTGFFNNASHLYSTIRHELIHVEQGIRDPFKYIGPNVFPDGFVNPSESVALQYEEFEAYRWEEQNMDKTGLVKHPDDIWNLFKQLAKGEHAPPPSDTANSKLRKQSAANLWETAFSQYLDITEKAISAAKGKPMTDAEYKAFEGKYDKAKDLWGYRSNFSSIAAKYQERYDKLKEYGEDRASALVSAKFAGKITQALKDYAAATSDYDGFNVWRPLMKAWDSMKPKHQKPHEAAYTKAMATIWPGAFDMMDADMKKMFAVDPKDSNIDSMWYKLRYMLNHTTESKVDPKVRAAKKKIFDAWHTKLNNRK